DADRQRLEICRVGRVVGEGAVTIIGDGGAVRAGGVGAIAGRQADGVARVLGGRDGDNPRGGVFGGGGGDGLRHRTCVGDVDRHGRGGGRFDAVVVGDGVV